MRVRRLRAGNGHRGAEALSFDVPFRSDGFFNATVVAKQFGKRPNDWLGQEGTKDYIAQVIDFLPLQSGLVTEQNQLVITKAGGNQQGTWLHPKLGVAFARWLDTRFAVWCDMQIDAILRGGAGLLTENQRVDLFRYFADVHARWLGGEQYPYDLEELVPTVFSRKDNAVKKLLADYKKDEDYQVLRKTAEYLINKEFSSSPNPEVKYFLSCACFEHLAPRRSPKLWNRQSRL